VNVQMIGCSHQNVSIDVLERLAFSPDQLRTALARFHEQFPKTEAVLLSTCNRVELYTAPGDDQAIPDHRRAGEFLAEARGLKFEQLRESLQPRDGEAALKHLFTVVASLDSMVVGEAQILSQVKQAYEIAAEDGLIGTELHAAFQSALRVAKRVATETAIHQRRVSIPSVAVADFAASIFERFDNKHTVLVGAGEMGAETLEYLIAEGAREISIVNRNPQRAEELAERFGGQPRLWDELDQLLAAADLVVSTTGATEPIVSLEHYRRIEPLRYDRPLFILDLAIPRDFDPAIDECAGVYLYSIGDLEHACQRNRAARRKDLPKAQRIVDDEVRRFKAESNHRLTGPTIRRLKDSTDNITQAELSRLINKLGDIDPGQSDEIARSFDRLVNKLLHPPLESLRDQAERGTPHTLLAALRQLFQLKE
jgi:glutamyl-tRNA reductase